MSEATVQFLSSKEAQLVVLFAFMAALVAVGVYLILKFRPGREDDDSLPTSKLMTEFRDLHSSGVLSDDEFGAVKTVLNDKMQQEVKEGLDPPKPAAKPPQDGAGGQNLGGFSPGGFDPNGLGPGGVGAG